MTSPSSGVDQRPTFFFDLDNCLYSKDRRIGVLMGKLISKYFQEHLELSVEDAETLHQQYYTMYGLALEGLVRHHKIDPLEYNTKVDDALPLDDLLKPDPALKQLLSSIDRTKYKTWIFTNAYINHAKRCLKLLDLEDMFEGITYCDYAEPQLVCKPHPNMFEKAMREARITDKEKCFFVDDSSLNVNAAKEFGWKVCVHLHETEWSGEIPNAGTHTIHNLAELKDIPELKSVFR
ncbi:hypothetical protein PROFUN_02886 [Planoprotostelium fungivorum]|uniref:Pyrimidine 5-nucleotidase n=1 Tax=Planoprotostelium fungivorum TaxID=1890364 RepID=A0A2P6NS03_9EUKA|nr:hypothetical protein PROFUN_02886 [Planoprotostelium fungivorum]